ncbi:MAG: RBBP9/YdeN family alpha/beta hydrolase [Gammaproteobacteria bacterium]
MRTAEAELLIVPGWSSSGEDHWQTRWENSLMTARRIDQADWFSPARDAWVERIGHEIGAAKRPVIVIAHSLGVIATVAALLARPERKVAGAFLVAPADVDNARDWPETEGFTFDPVATGFGHVPVDRLPVPSAVIASRNDPYCSIERAQALALAWGSRFHDAGDAGHINAASGHGPWPEGLMQLGRFLKSLPAANG